MAPSGAALPPALLRKLQRLYHGPSGGGVAAEAAGAPPSLLTISRSSGAGLRPPPYEATIVVVGERGSGKSSFINAYAEDTLLPLPAGAAARDGRKPPPLSWVRSRAATTEVPALLAAAALEFPALGKPAFCMAGATSSRRLDAVDLVEVRTEALADPALCEAIAWLAARAGVVLCLADARSRQPATLSAELLAFLKHVVAEAPDTLHFVLSKVELVPRESERIRLTAKVSKQLSESLGRSFEVLPMARKDKRHLLMDVIERAPTTVSFRGKTFEVPAVELYEKDALDAGTAKVTQAAEACAAARLAEGAARLRGDALDARGAVEARLASLPRPGALAELDVRPRLLQGSGALGITAAVVPLVVEEDFDESLVTIFRLIAAALACVLLLLYFVSAPTKKKGDQVTGKPAASASGALDQGVARALARGSQAVELLGMKMREEARYCDLVARQGDLWSSQAAA